MKPFFLILLIGGCFLCLNSAKSSGQNQSPDSPVLKQTLPIQITANALEIFEKQKKSVWKGNVVAIHGNVTLYCDTAEVYYTLIGNRRILKEIHAISNVKVVKEDSVITCYKAIFYNQERKIVCTGNPTAWSKKDVLIGDQMTLFLDSETVNVTNPRGEIFPKSEGPGGEKKKGAKGKKEPTTLDDKDL